jgi:hypothetical protein
MRKCWISECPERDGNHILLQFQVVMNSRPALSTEMKCCFLSGIAGTRIRRGVAPDLDVDPAKAGLRAKCTSGPALTSKAVATETRTGSPVAVAVS